MRSAVPQLSLFPPDEQFLEAKKPGQSPGFSVRESARAKRLSIKVYPRGKVEVVVPRRTRPGDVATFVAENAEWIRRARESFAVEHEPEPFALPRTICLPAVGAEFAVRYVPQKGSKGVRARQSDNWLVLSGRTADEKLCIDAIKRWLARFAKQEFAPRLEALSTMSGLDYDRMQVRAQRTCWGSRSSSGTLSLNLCLLFLRPELLRYLMIHELSHGRHMNHSRRFWNLVGRLEPDYRQLDKDLAESWRDVPAWLGLY